MTGEAGTLWVCAVPIGNLGDVSPRLREVLGRVDVIACEDTRTTRSLLQLLGVETDARLLAHHLHKEESSAAGIVELLTGGSAVALVSDAGTPAVSDPGSELVASAHRAGIEVVCVPGPSAVVAALSLSGCRGTGFRFVGFLPRGERDLAALLDAGTGDVLVGLDSPHRVQETLERIDMAQPERIVVLCRELTKRHEQVLRGTAADVLEQLDLPVRGEIVLVLDQLEASADAAAAAEAANTAATALARDLGDAGLRTKEAARIATRHLGGSSRVVYARIIAGA